MTTDIDGKSWKFAPKRNHQRMNQCVAKMVISWMANTDFQPATSIKGLVEHAVKYCSKPEKESKFYNDLTKEVIKHVSSRTPLLPFTAKLLNKSVGGRDWAAQEVSHILLNLPLVSSSLDVVTLDCRPESSQQDAIEKDR